MHRSRTACLIAATAFVVAGATAVAPRASAIAPAAGAAYVAAQATPVPFEPPEAAGETAPLGGTAAVESAEPVEGAPGETGIETEIPPEFMGD